MVVSKADSWWEIASAEMCASSKCPFVMCVVLAMQQHYTSYIRYCVSSDWVAKRPAEPAYSETEIIPWE